MDARARIAYYKAKYPEGGQKDDKNIPSGAIVPQSVSPVSQWPDEMNLAVKEYFIGSEGAGGNLVDPRQGGQQSTRRSNQCPKMAK